MRPKRPPSPNMHTIACGRRLFSATEQVKRRTLRLCLDLFDHLGWRSAGRCVFKPNNVLKHNQLLGAMEPAVRRRLAPYLERVTHKLDDLICEAGGHLRHAYFPEGGVLSLLTVLENGDAIETANIGREGAFGLFAAMYSPEYPSTDASCAAGRPDGPGARLKFYTTSLRHSEQVRNLFVSYSETLLSQVQQTVACNAMHTVEERMGRWLLMMDDRAEGESLTYTHDFLSHWIMGANRKSVTPPPL